ncbi:WG repeat-containing protein, partial [bacterium]|nr:WG repeat-containing protein [bacterium]
MKVLLSIFLILIIITTGYTKKSSWKENDTLYPLEKNKKWGFMDYTGKIVIEPVYMGAKTFSNGLCAVRSKNKKGYYWGYIDKTGKVMIEPKFEIAHTFHNGAAIVLNNGKYYFIDVNGIQIGNHSFNEA